MMRKFLTNPPTKEEKERERDEKYRRDGDKKDKKGGGSNPFASLVSPNNNPFRRTSQQHQQRLVDAPPPPYAPPLPSDGSVAPTGSADPPAPQAPKQQSAFQTAAHTLWSATRTNSFRTQAPPTDPYANLARFDTVFLIDDSSSMAGSRWAETGRVLAEIVPVCTRYDRDGVDVHFLNAVQHTGHNLRQPSDVVTLFGRVEPAGLTPTGRRLGDLLTHYLKVYRRNPSTKPLNIICITDGEPTDPTLLEKVLERTAKSLDELDAPDRQVGVQFFQVGNDSNATLALDELDNGMAEKGIRDMVDTVSFTQINGGNGLTSGAILKVVLGAVDKALDRKRRIT